MKYERAIDTLDGAVLSDNVTESYQALGDGLAWLAAGAGPAEGGAMEL